nr:3-oxoacyl-ACP synthase [Flaviramulus sp.]
MGIKQKLFDKCVEFIEKRNQIVQYTINEIQESLKSETKSSAGDKHETGRAMLQLEREKAGKQLSEIENIKQTLAKIKLDNSSQIINFGSVVYTSKANYFISISAGELKVGKDVFFAISANTPIGQLLIGKMLGDEVVFRSQSFTITEVS